MRALRVRGQPRPGRSRARRASAQVRRLGVDLHGLPRLGDSGGLAVGGDPAPAERPAGAPSMYSACSIFCAWASCSSSGHSCLANTVDVEGRARVPCDNEREDAAHVGRRDAETGDPLVADDLDHARVRHARDALRLLRGTGELFGGSGELLGRPGELGDLLPQVLIFAPNLRETSSADRLAGDQGEHSVRPLADRTLRPTGRGRRRLRGVVGCELGVHTRRAPS